MSITNFLAQRNVTAAFPSTLPDNTVQVSAAHSLDYTTFGQNWSALAAPVQAWTDIAVSSNGQYLTACVNAGSIYCSMNYGQTWTIAAGTSSLAWSALAMSASGQYQVAAVNSGSIYYSSNYGVTWAASATVGTTAVAWSSVAMSASGAYVTATVNGVSIWYSTTYGQTWLVAAGTSSLAWSAVAMSASGQYQVASVAAGAIYYSSTFGVSWTASSSSSLQWSSLAMSASGQYATALVGVNTSATVAAGYIFYSTNYGQTWTQTGTSNYWKSVTMSASGQYQLATTNFPSLLYNYGFNTTDVQGANVLDYATSLYGAQLINGATISTSSVKVGTGALSLTATASQYAQLPPFQMSSSYTGLTIAGWVNLSAGNARNARFFDLSGALKNASGQISGAGTAYSYVVGYNDGTFYISLASTTSSGSVALPIGSYTIPYTLGSWAHIAWVMTSTTWQIYVNGSLITPTIATAVTGGYYLPPTSYNGGLYPNFFLGRSSWTTDVYATGFWDDFRLYTTALNATQVSALYNSNAGILGTLQYSSNFGQTWQSTSGVQANYSALAMSSSGQYVTGCINGSTMYQGITSEPNIASQSLTVAGTTQTGALGFLDGSVSTTAAPVLDYSTFGQNWSVVSGLSSQNWDGLCTSANGQYVSVAIRNGVIYYSNNYGQNWTVSNAPTGEWHHMACSASGQYQTACYGTVISSNYYNYYSTNYGVTWTQSATSFGAKMVFVAVSASGQYQTTVTFAGPTVNNIYYSTNYGQTWTLLSPNPMASQSLYAVAMSASGQYQTVASNLSGLYYSTNYGQSWAISNAPTALYWSSIAISASGQYQTAQNNSASPAINIWYSTNYGVSWIPTIISIGSTMGNINMTASGQYQITATTNTSNILYYSTNYGVTWSTITMANSLYYFKIAMSATGQYIYIGAHGGNVYKSVTRSPSIFSSGSIILGNAASTNNQPQINYTQIGIGSTTNYASIGFASNANTICWTANGNVGIGTTNPTQPLTIYNSTANHILSLINSSTSTNYMSFSTNGTNYGLIGCDNSIGGGLFGSGVGYGFCIGTQTATPICFSTNNIIRMTILSGGNVGIGTKAPLNLLTLQGTGGQSCTIAFNDADNPVPYVGIGYDRTYDSLSFYTNQGSVSLNTVSMVLKRTSQYVGIGTTNPTSLLHVNGAINCTSFLVNGTGHFTGNLQVDGNIYTSTGISSIDAGSGWAPSNQSIFTSSILFYRGWGTGGYGGYGFSDAISFNTWKDDSGGAQNLLALSKGGLAMRIYQVGFGSTAAWNTSTNYADVVLKNSSGNVGIGLTTPSYTLHVSGAIYASGDITALSDQRHKQNITPLTDSLAAITQLSGYSYTRSDYKPGEKQIGLIAQEVKEVYPEAVSYDDVNDTYSLNYGCLMAPVIQAIKEMKDRIERQDLVIQQLLDSLGPQ